MLIEFVGDKPADQLTGVDLLVLVRRALESGRMPAGINVNLRCLHAFGRWCAKQKLLDRDNPFAGVDLLKVPATPIRYLNHEEFRRIYNAESKPLLGQIYLVALVTGQRCGDVLRLRWEMIDLQRAVIRLVNKKTNRLNTIPIHSMLMEVLQKMGLKSEGPLFVGRRGEKLTVSYASHQFLKAARRARVDGVTFHTLRKTFASWLALSGVGLHEIQKLLGHSSVTLTEKYYASLCASELHGTIARLQPVTGSLPNLVSGPQPNADMTVHRVRPMMIR